MDLTQIHITTDEGFELTYFNLSMTLAQYQILTISNIRRQIFWNIYKGLLLGGDTNSHYKQSIKFFGA